MYSQSDPFWKKPYKVRKRVDSIDRYPNKVGTKYHQHMSPIDVFKEYCEKTTLHGIRYTMRDGAPTYDRLSWVITLVVCASFAGLFVKTAWVKFRNSPTVTSVETTHLPLHKVPFPAITICPATKVNKFRGLNALKVYLNLTHLNSSMETELEHVMSAFSMLQHPFYDRMVPHLDDIPDLTRYDGLNVTAFMLEVYNTLRKFKDELPDGLRSRLTPHFSKPPNLYGLPKVHKSSKPLRPIVSFKYSPCHPLVKHLTTILKPLGGKSSFFVKDSEDFISKIKDLNINGTDTLVMPTYEELFHGCFWLGRGSKCSDVFYLQRSENGFCYSFNSLTSENGSTCPAWKELEADGVNEVGHRENMRKECQLRRNTGAGTTTGLEVFLKPSNNESRLIMGQRDLNGARILIHHPSEFPEAGKGLFLPEATGDVFTVKVSPAVTVTNEAVRNLAPNERNCIFPDERQLTIYHTYTQPGCLTECRINFIVKECGCTPYYFDINHDKTPECSLSELRCIANHSLDLRFFRPPEGTRGFSEWSNLDCLHCLPTCHETVYNLESSLSQDNNPMLSTSRGYLDVYYKDLGVVKYHRSLMFDKMQLIVSFGGIAGLFLGVSLLSVVELFYYAIKLLIATYYELLSLNSKPQKTIKQNLYTSENTTPAPT